MYLCGIPRTNNNTLRPIIFAIWFNISSSFRGVLDKMASSAKYDYYRVYTQQFILSVYNCTVLNLYST